MSESLDELVAQLDAANVRVREAGAARDFVAYRALQPGQLALERRVAAARGEEYAEPLEFPVAWNVGVPMPHLMVNDHRALLAFLIHERDPNWDGTYATMKSATDLGSEPFALVEFDRCTSAKLGAPNDEVLAGHPLAGRGLDGYTAQRVVNSRWLAELEQINRIHSQYRAETWRERHHYVLWFHDTTFECIARGFRVETHRMSMRALLGRMVERLNAR